MKFEHIQRPAVLSLTAKCGLEPDGKSSKRRAINRVRVYLDKNKAPKKLTKEEEAVVRFIEENAPTADDVTSEKAEAQDEKAAKDKKEDKTKSKDESKDEKKTSKKPIDTLKDILKTIGLQRKIKPSMSIKRATRIIVRHTFKKGIDKNLSKSERVVVDALVKKAKAVKKTDTPTGGAKASRGKVLEGFIAYFTKDKQWLRSEVVAKLSKSLDVPPATISNYISWAKQTWKPTNPFGFYLKEVRENSDGTLTKTKADKDKKKKKR